MLSDIWFGLMAIGLVVAAVNGTAGAVSQSAVEPAGTAVQIAIGLVGVMALWLRMMRVAEAAGLVTLVAIGNISRRSSQQNDPLSDAAAPPQRDLRDTVRISRHSGTLRSIQRVVRRRTAHTSTRTPQGRSGDVQLSAKMRPRGGGRAGRGVGSAAGTPRWVRMRARTSAW